MTYPRLLVIANNSLSDNNSNGRTLAGFLRGWDKDKLTQIYVTGEMPSSTVCDKFFRITDKEVLYGLVRKNDVGSIVHNTTNNKPACLSVDNKIKKTVFSIMTRDLLWKSNVWDNKKLRNFLQEFKPEIILFFAGESCFTFKITEKIAHKYNLPIIMYNSEGYYFNEENYLLNSGFSKYFYPLFHKKFKRCYEKMMKNVCHVIYINDRLKNDCDKCFNAPSTTIYTATELETNSFKNIQKPPVVVYLGNLGRHGEKMYETLLTNEECAKAIDMGEFYRVPVDSRGLNYDKYFTDGDAKRNSLSEFNSNNTDLLNVEQVKEKLLSLEYIKNQMTER